MTVYDDDDDDNNNNNNQFTLEQATKALMGSTGIALLFLQTRRKMEVGGKRHDPDALPPGKTR
jgi:hypothetical protein